MENQVEEIKSKLDIVNVISRHLPLKKRGRHYIACCPFHQEKTPSFTVSPELQIFKCFGCGKGGDVFTFIQEFERVEFPEALEILAKQAGVVLKKTPQFSAQVSHSKVLLDINKNLSRFYHYLLVSHPLGKNALDYVLKRGISLDTIKTFQIGFSPQNSQLLLNFLHKKNFADSDLIDTGTIGRSQYAPSRFYDRFSSRLVFPLIDHRQNILGFSGRTLPGALDNQAKYINSPETLVYHKSHMVFGLNLAKDFIRDAKTVIVTEGEFDMISPFQAGIKNIVAVKGTAFTLEQLQLLRRYADTLILALDSDFAGTAAAQKSIQLADSLDFDIKVLSLGRKYKDPDEAVQADPAFFKKQLASALPIWDFLILSSVRQYDSSTVKGKKAILSTVLPFLIKIENSVIRSDYFKKLADAVNSDYEAVSQEAGKYGQNNPTPPPVSLDSLPPLSLQEKLEKNLLLLILGSKHPSRIVRNLKKDLKIIALPSHQKLISLLSQKGRFSPQKIQQKLPPEMRDIFQSLFVRGTSIVIDSPRRLLEIKKLISQLQIDKLKNQLSALGQEIVKSEAKHQEKQLLRLESRYNRLLTKLSHLQVTK